MLSHACARCGSGLDASSRSFSGAARLWVAACDRCGFAVAWNPRRAREGARTWARLRALNLRLGIAISAGQVAAILLVVASAIVIEPTRRMESHLHVDALTVILAGAASVSAAVSAIAIAPFRSALARVAGAWIIVVLPTYAAVGILSCAADLSPSEIPAIVRAGALPLLFGLAATAIASLVVCLAIAPAHASLAHRHVARLRTNRRGVIAFAKGAHR